MPTAATATEFRSDLIDLIEDAFDDQFDVLSGKLPRHMGSDGDYCGVSTARQAPRSGQMNDQEITVVVQFHLQYPKEKPIQPKLVTDQSAIETVVETFQAAVEDNGRGSGTTSGRWYFNIVGVDYPDDPIGQKSRAEVTLVSHGTNPAINLVETI